MPVRHSCEGRDRYPRKQLSDCLVGLTFKPALRCEDGPLPSQGRCSAYAGVTVDL